MLDSRGHPTVETGIGFFRGVRDASIGLQSELGKYYKLGVWTFYNKDKFYSE